MMTLPSKQHTAQRKVALLLHALGVKDQQLIIKELPKQQQKLIKHYVQELTQLGVTKDKKWLQDAMQSTKTLAESDKVAYLNNVDAAQLLPFLKDEPAYLQQTILTLYPWRWKSALSQALNISDLAPVDSIPSHSAGLLIDSLYQQLQQSAGHK